MPAAIRRETRMRLWREVPKYLVGENMIIWGGRLIPVSQLTREGRMMLGVYDANDYPKIEMPIPRLKEKVGVEN